jgi:hypothetical protein
VHGRCQRGRGGEEVGEFSEQVEEIHAVSFGSKRSALRSPDPPTRG